MAMAKHPYTCRIFVLFIFRPPDGNSSNDSNSKSKDGFKLHQIDKCLTVKDFDYLPGEHIDWESFGEENLRRLKEWTRQREKDLISQAAQLQHWTAICPVGRDRNFRRYWVFQSVPGLFVEQDGECILQAAKEETSETNTENYVPEEWWFLETTESVDSLLESLNPRGFREGPLRIALKEQLDRLYDWVKQCNCSTLVSPWTSFVDELSSVGSAEENLLCILREMILDFEERIFTGSLGSLKVKVSCFT